MSIAQVKAIREAVNESEELQERILAGDDWVEVAKTAGFEITQQDVETYRRNFDQGMELNDFELSAVAGGKRGIQGNSKG